MRILISKPYLWLKDNVYFKITMRHILRDSHICSYHGVSHFAREIFNQTNLVHVRHPLFQSKSPTDVFIFHIFVLSIIVRFCLDRNQLYYSNQDLVLSPSDPLALLGSWSVSDPCPIGKEFLSAAYDCGSAGTGTDAMAVGSMAAVSYQVRSCSQEYAWSG
jgi:hypothetical protein